MPYILYMQMNIKYEYFKISSFPSSSAEKDLKSFSDDYNLTINTNIFCFAYAKCVYFKNYINRKANGFATKDRLEFATDETFGFKADEIYAAFATDARMVSDI